MTSIERALAALAAGDLIGLPTDTVYGIAGDPFRRSAIERLFEAKGRPGIKPIPILGATVDDLRRVAVLDDEIARLGESHWPGGLTLVLRRAPGVPDWLGDSGRDTVGVRIPDQPVALEILQRWGPLAVTSANLSGHPPAMDPVSARSQLGSSIAEYLEGESPGGVPSTVVDLTGAEPRVLRSGAVEWGTS